MMRMKKFAALAMAGIMAAGLTACGSKDPAYLSGINPSDYVDVADYSNISVEEAQPSVTDDTVESYIQYTLSSNQETQEVTDRDDVENGDVVNIDYTGTKDGVAFDGGSATGYDLTIGSGSFIDGFEDGLIGHKKGETVTLNLTFPKDYSNKDLAGQPVVFKVKINKISTKVTPELTDEWVQGQNITGVETVDEYRKYVREQLMNAAQSNYNDDVQNKIVDYMMDNSTFKQDPPQEMIDRYFGLYEQNLTSAASQYGMDLDTYASLSGLVTSSSSESTEAATESTEASTESSTEAVSEAAEASTEASTESAEAGSADTEAAAEGTTGAAEESTTASTEAVSSASESSTGSTESSTGGSTEAAKMNDDTRAAITDLAKNQAKQLIMLGAVAQKENIRISERDYENAVATQAPSMGYTGLDDFEKGEDEEMFKEYLLEQKVVEFLQGKTKVTEPADESSTESTTESAEESSTGSTEESSAESSTAEAAE